MTNITPGWINIATCIEGDPVVINDLDLWQHTWHALGGDPIVVAHPSYPEQLHSMRVYELRSSEKIVTFAASELSNGVWGIYIPG